MDHAFFTVFGALLPYWILASISMLIAAAIMRRD